MEKKHLEELMKEFPLARKKIRIATFRLAFYRAMLALARVCFKELTSNDRRMDMFEALSIVREEKARLHPKLREPTKRVLANTLSALGDRVELIHEETRAALEAMQSSVDTQVGAMRTEVSAKLDALLAASGSGVQRPTPERARASGGRVLQAGGGRSGVAERPPTVRRKQRINKAATASGGASGALAARSTVCRSVTVDSAPNLCRSATVGASVMRRAAPLQTAAQKADVLAVSDDSDSSLNA